MILSAQSIRRRCDGSWIAIYGPPMIEPFCERTVHNGFTYGLSSCGYDVRIAEDVLLNPGDFKLASTIERFVMPHDLTMEIKDKSSWARNGLAVQNTVAEPGWRGHLTLELTNHLPPYGEAEFWSHWINSGKFRYEPRVLQIAAGTPIAQVMFKCLDEPTEQPYEGRYQDQPAGATPAIPAKEGDR